MACTRPNIVVLDHKDINPETGKPRVYYGGYKVRGQFMPLKSLSELNYDLDTFRNVHGLEVVKVPCGKCHECMKRKARDWSIRAYHESLLHKKNCFITLTYNDENLPDIFDENSDRSPKVDIQKFMKRLRKALAENDQDKIRYFHVFEYGSQFSRPHHHIILFGTDMPDKVFFQIRENFPVFTSPLLNDKWRYGFHTVQNVNFQVCAYVARYCMKKIDKTEDWYDGRIPEFNLMSRRPGLGHDWLLSNLSDVYNSDKMVMKEYVSRPPKYYDYLFDGVSPDAFATIKEKRRELATANSDNIVSDVWGFNARHSAVLLEKYNEVKISRQKRDYEKEV